MAELFDYHSRTRRALPETHPSVIFFLFFFSAFPRRLIIEEPHCPALFYLFILPLTNVTGRLILLNEVLEQLALATQVKPPGCSKRTASISFFFLAREPEDATW